MDEISADQNNVQVAQNHGGPSVGVRGQRGNYGGAGNQYLRPEACRMSVNVGELTDEELEDLLHMIADEIRLRRMQTADDGK